MELLEALELCIRRNYIFYNSSAKSCQLFGAWRGNGFFYLRNLDNLQNNPLRRPCSRLPIVDGRCVISRRSSVNNSRRNR